MTRKETEVFFKDCPRLFSNFLNSGDFCFPYGSGWFDILHKCCLELEVLNKDGTYIVFKNSDYIINEIDKQHTKRGIIKFCVNVIKPVIIYSSFHNRLETLSSIIIGKLMDESSVTCEKCGIRTDKPNNVIENNVFKCICDSCLEKIKGNNNEQCNNQI